MTSASLSLGCALLAFSPTATLLLLFTYSKAQLVIIVTTSAFAQLLACLCASILHLPFTLLDLGKDQVFAIIPASILSQAFFRCAFVRLYHKIETVIEQSIRKHELDNHGGEDSVANNDGNNNNNHGGQWQTSSNDSNNNNNNNSEVLSETAKLRLEINDLSCALASAVGFGGMHAVVLYGTLLASESNKLGTLYQPSCSMMPSLVNSAIMACLFSVLDVVWMMMTFYGMRRMKGSLFGINLELPPSAATTNTTTNTVQDFPGPWSFQRGAMGGKAALATVLISHSAASFATVANRTMEKDGCVVALPLLAAVVLVTVGVFGFFYRDNYLPEGQRNRIRQASTAGGEHLE